MMIGNKTDLIEEEKLEELKEKFESNELKCFYTSAKEGTNITQSFT